VVTPTTVDDSQLSGMPVGRLTGIPDGPTVLPKSGQAATTWAVCDDIPRDTNALSPTGHNQPSTTVIAGEQNVGPNLPNGQALLVSDDNGQTEYLVYGLAGSISNHVNDGAVRAQVDVGDSAVTSALSIDRNQYRVVSSAVLNAIPTVATIQDPTFGLDKNQPVVQPLQSAGLSMGESFSVQQLGQGLRYYIAVPNGMQEVSETTAQIARFVSSHGQQVIPGVQPDAVDSVRTVTNGLQVNVNDYPGALPKVISADQKPAMCLAWSANYADPQKPIAETRVTVDIGLNLPIDPTTHQQMSAVQIGQATSSGKITSFFMNPGLGGAAVRAATGPGQFSNGQIFVIDPRGVKFSVPDVSTAQVLGIADGTTTGDVPPAPQSIVGLLPGGGSPLSIQAVQKTFDTMPPMNNVGQFIPQANSNGGGN
jgi:type VII secretion protein EccB